MISEPVQCDHCHCQVRHGLDSTYGNHGCRCDDCKDAHSLARRLQRQGDRAEKYPAIVAFRHAPWMAESACRGVDTNLFFDRRNYAMLRAVYCWKCETRSECLDMQLAAERMGPRVGLFGGMDEQERVIEARRRDGARREMVDA
jgi:hypothetical protein